MPHDNNPNKFCSVACRNAFYAGANHYNMGNTKDGLEAKESPSLRDIAWAAGFYEGEGSCKRTGREGCQMHIGQKQRWPLERMQSLFGGHIGIGRHNNEVYYNWSASGTRARGILMTFYSFLSPRRQAQALAAFAVAV